jgi:hypothetical protein
MSRWIQALGVIVSIALVAGCQGAPAPEQPPEEVGIGMSFTGLDGTGHRLVVMERGHRHGSDIARVVVDGRLFELVLGPGSVEVRNQAGGRIAALGSDGVTTSLSNGDSLLLSTGDSIIELTPELVGRLDRVGVLLLDEAIIRAIFQRLSEARGDGVGESRQPLGAMIPIVLIACCVEAEVGSDGWRVGFDCDCL